MSEYRRFIWSPSDVIHSPGPIPERTLCGRTITREWRIAMQEASCWHAELDGWWNPPQVCRFCKENNPRYFAIREQPRWVWDDTPEEASE